MCPSASENNPQPNQAEETASGSVSLFRKLKSFFGFIAIILSWWVAIITFLIGQSIFILIYADGYKPATFTIEKLVYFNPAHRGRGRPDEYFAMGSVDGKTEKFKLGKYVKGTIQNYEDLETQFDIGQKLPVLYNPGMPEKLELRVLYPEENFKTHWESRQKQVIRTGYLPWGAAIALCFFFGIVSRKIKSSFGFFFASLFFVAVG